MDNTGDRMVVKDILVVVDMQCAVFQTPRWNAGEIVRRINLLSASVRGRGGKVIWVQHADADIPSGGEGWQILPSLNVDTADARVEKHVCDSFYQTNLQQLLAADAPERIIFAGCATDFCLDSTIRHAATIGLPVWVAGDAHTTAHKPHAPAETIIAHHNFVWENFEGSGDPIRVVDTDALL